jgi:streptogramin lyase
MSEKKCFGFGKIFYAVLVLAVLTIFVISSCEEKEKAPEIDPNTLPLANFFVDDPVYRTIEGNVYAFVTAHDRSSYSNRWEWDRPGSRSEPIKFTTDKDSTVTQVYAATNEIQRFNITLVTYNVVQVNPDSVRIFKSNPCGRIVTIKKP